MDHRQASREGRVLIALSEELRRDLPGARDRVDAEAESMQSAIDPRAALAALHETNEDATDAAEPPAPHAK